MLSPIPFRRQSKQLRLIPIAEASAEPVSLADYKLYIRQANLSISQTVFDSKVRAARRLCEKYLNQKLVAQTLRGVMDLPPGVEWNGAGGSLGSILARFLGYNPVPLELAYGPLRQVNGLFITDDNGSVITLDPSSYWVSTSTNPARLALRQTAVWPDALGRSFETFSVEYAVGYSIPFTASGATLTSSRPHGLVNGSVQRLWTTSDGQLPDGLTTNTDYYVVNSAATTFGLSASLSGSAIATNDAGSGTLFVGEIPENFLRAILATAAVYFSPDKTKGARPMVGALPDEAKEMLGLDRVYNL